MLFRSFYDTNLTLSPAGDVAIATWQNFNDNSPYDERVQTASATVWPRASGYTATTEWSHGSTPPECSADVRAAGESRASTALGCGLNGVSSCTAVSPCRMMSPDNVPWPNAWAWASGTGEITEPPGKSQETRPGRRDEFSLLRARFHLAIA